MESFNWAINFALKNWNEALELWITHRLFGLDAWARLNGLSIRQGLAQMAAVLGFELDASFWDHLPPA